MNESLALLYFQVTDLWKQLCQEHNLLFNLTCDEYSLLLRSELDLLEEKIIEKQICIERIATLEAIRKDLILDLKDIYPNKEINGVSELLEIMSEYEIENNQKHLRSFNSLLIDIIEKVQTQNKRNQLFINKALINLQQMKLEASGKKKFSTYSKKGSSVSINT